MNNVKIFSQEIKNTSILKADNFILYFLEHEEASFLHIFMLRKPRLVPPESSWRYNLSKIIGLDGQNSSLFKFRGLRFSYCYVATRAFLVYICL